jgi:biotin carboxylase
MDALRVELREAEARAAAAEEGRSQLRQELEAVENRMRAAEAAAAVELEGMEGRLRAAEAAAVAAAEKAKAAVSVPSVVAPVVGGVGVGVGVARELRKLQAELRATKRRLDTAQTNQTLLQRYIAVRRLGEGEEGSGVVKEGEGVPAADAPAAGAGVGGLVSYLLPTN